MQESEQFVASDSDDFTQKETIFADRRVPVLKFLPQARELLKGKNQPYEIFSPRCLFPQELTRIPRALMPKQEQSTRAAGNRLQSMEDALYQHGKMKEKLRESLTKQDKELRYTLWDLYGEKEPYYSRFQPASRKQNFAAVLMPMAGIVIDAKTKVSNFPQIKGKAGLNQWNNGSLFFDSHFESGNLLYVFKGEQRGAVQSYDLVLQNDVNTRGHNQWFHFKMTSTRKHQKVKINIVNLVKKESLFSYGLKPLAYSDKQPKLGWVRSGHKINYEENLIKREQKASSYYTLSFQYEFREAYESVYFAPSYPYSYSQLVYFMESLLSEPRYRNILTITKLCETVGKNTVNLITISAGKIPVEDCKVVWIMGRQHPVETTSSYMVEGLVTHLLQTVAKQGGKGGMIDQYVFKIVPMVNPDGVIHGNTRAELTGIDPNRVWKKTSKTITPTIHTIKKKILKSPGQVSMILDLHSHSKKLGCFFYGNYEQSDIKSYRILPSTISQQDPRFTYKNCRFKRGHDSSARLALFNELSIPHIYTVECSLLGYIKDNRVCEYKISDYHEMAIRIMEVYLSLEKQSAPTAYPHQSTDCCDVQSARSDSEVSDEEYSEVYNFARGRKKTKEIGKNKPRSNTLIYTHKPQVSELPKKRQNSAVKTKEVIKMQEETIVTANRSETMRPEPKREFSIKLRNNKVATRNLKITKRKEEAIKEEMGETDKVYEDKAAQIEQLRQSNNNVDIGKLKVEKKQIMVVGSGVDEKDSCVGIHEVGGQIDYSKENLAQPQNSLRSHHPSSKLKFSRRKTDLHETQLGERPSYPRPLMFRN